jgi:hypothetical protein
LKKPRIYRPDRPFVLVSEKKGIDLFENREALPTAFMVFEAFAATDREAIDFVTSADTNTLSRLIALDRDASLRWLSGGPQYRFYPGRYQVKRIFRRPGAVKYLVQSQTPGLLFESVNYYPGWKAYLDGRETPLIRADHAFRAVYVPAGRHVLKMTFEPIDFRLGIWIGLTTLICGLMVSGKNIISLLFAKDRKQASA